MLPLFLWFPFYLYSQCRSIITMFKCLRGQDLNTPLIMSFLHNLLRQLYSLGAIHLLQPRMKYISNGGKKNFFIFFFFQFKMFQFLAGFPLSLLGKLCATIILAKPLLPNPRFQRKQKTSI